MVVDNDTYTKLLLHCDGADEATTIPDLSASGHTITVGNNVELDTAQYKFGISSALFDGTTDYLLTPSHSDFTFADGNFTLDAWVRPDTGFDDGKNPCIFGTNDIYNYVLRVNAIDVAELLELYVSSNGTSWNEVSASYGSTSLVAGTWYHITMARNSTSLKVYLDGTAEIDETLSAGASIGGTYACFGAWMSTFVNSWLGWMDEIRVSKGIARWTDDFTPPTSAYALGISVHDCTDLKEKVGG